jgi:hypothetical protein
MRELCERPDRGWRIHKPIFKLHHNCATASPQCELGIEDCGRQTETMGFWSQNHFTLIPRRHTKFEAETATDVVIDRKTLNQTGINGPQWFMRDFADKVKASENTGVAASSEKMPAEVSRDKIHRDEAHRDKVGQDKIRRDKDKRRRPERPGIAEAPDWARNIMRSFLPQTVGAEAGVEPG